MKDEKYIKSKKNELKDLKYQLQSARKELERALELAESIAYCCTSSIQELVDSVDQNIDYTEMHIKQGLLELDIINEESV